MEKFFNKFRRTSSSKTGAARRYTVCTSNAKQQAGSKALKIIFDESAAHASRKLTHPEHNPFSSRNQIRSSTVHINQKTRENQDLWRLNLNNCIKIENNDPIPIDFTTQAGFSTEKSVNRLYSNSISINSYEKNEISHDGSFFKAPDKINIKNRKKKSKIINNSESFEIIDNKCLSISYKEIINIKKLNKSFDCTQLSYKNENSEESYEANESNYDIYSSDKYNLKKTVRSCIIETSDVHPITFQQAIKEFHNAPKVYVEKSLWKKSWDRFLNNCCSAPPELTAETLEICEKFILCSHTGYLENSLYHNNMLTTVSYLLNLRTQVKEKWTEIGFSSDNPYEDDLKHPAASMGLLLLIFLDEYFPTTLTQILKYSLDCGIALIPLSFDITGIIASVLRKRQLHKLMGSSEKPLEILFFLYAGCIACWLTMHKEKPRDPDTLNKIIQKSIQNTPHLLICIAKEHLKRQ
jgi:ELMO/CED-12 family